MKKNLFLSVFLALSALSYAQSGNVGINTTSPNTTLDVVGKPSNSSSMDGITAPRLTGSELKAKVYTSAQTGALVYVTSADPSPSGQTVNVTTSGYYYFNGTSWILSDQTNDAFVNNSSGGRVELGTQSDGTTSRSAGTEFVIKDDGKVGIGTSSPLYNLHLGKTGSQIIADFDSSTGQSGFIGFRDLNPSTSLPIAGMNVRTTGELRFYNNSTLTSAQTSGGFQFRPAGASAGATFVIDRNGLLGVGTNTPTTKMHIYSPTSGAFRISDGTERTGYVLTSDASGVATWKQSGGTIAANEGTAESSNNNAWSFTINNSSAFTVLPSFTSTYLTTGVYFVTLYQCPGQLTISPVGEGAYWSLISSDGGVGSGEAFFAPLTAGACSGYQNFIFKVTNAGSFTLAARKYNADLTLSAPAGFDAAINAKIDSLSH